MLQQLFIYENFFNDSISTFLFEKESLPTLFNSLYWIWLGWATRWSICAVLPYQNSANVILRVGYAASSRKYSASRLNLHDTAHNSLMSNLICARAVINLVWHEITSNIRDNSLGIDNTLLYTTKPLWMLMSFECNWLMFFLGSLAVIDLNDSNLSIINFLSTKL